MYAVQTRQDNVVKVWPFRQKEEIGRGLGMYAVPTRQNNEQQH